MPLDDGAANTTTFLEPRFVLHTKPKERVSVGQTFTDAQKRTFLLAQHDQRADLRRSFRLFQMTAKVAWGRMSEVTDLITGLKKGEKVDPLGNIWVSFELYGREEVDRVLHIGIDRVRVVTGAPVQLNDYVDGKRVSRLTKVFGVSVLEIT
ncbi:MULTISPECIES: hypothetical protein [unclassified Beijerinckia]|uniref:hypothetical protein n=1 Tax=unclassified Beijerinckia TaxID=2638183 RepID=UPI00089C706A|nr:MULTISPECIES: hypothetical protein [unclassified Beijerinckia]MDH7796428.1 hypothetical protein [Beijerinckia sp. GAS462]SEC44671.1 hypothetical protein SAMN05443249_2710 [Beijerinckia sp. 28-YEA-48]